MTTLPAATVPIEIASWITKFVGGDGSGRRVVDEPLAPGATVRSVLTGLSAKFPELHKALWHGKDLGEHIEALDANPIVAGPDGCVAVDALVVPRTRRERH